MMIKRRHATLRGRIFLRVGGAHFRAWHKVRLLAPVLRQRAATHRAREFLRVAGSIFEAWRDDARRDRVCALRVRIAQTRWWYRIGKECLRVWRVEVPRGGAFRRDNIIEARTLQRHVARWSPARMASPRLCNGSETVLSMGGPRQAP